MSWEIVFIIVFVLVIIVCSTLSILFGKGSGIIGGDGNFG